MQSFKPVQLLSSLVILIYAGLIVFLPTVQFMPDFMFIHDRQRLLQLVLLLSVLVYSLFSFTQNKPFVIANKTSYALYVLLAFAITSSLLAHNPRHAMIEVSIFAASCYLALFFAQVYFANKELLIKWLIIGLLVSIGLYVFAFFVGYIAACLSKKSLTWPAPMLGFNNVRFFNQYQLWGLSLAYLPLLNNHLTNSKKLLLNLLLVLWWSILFYAASRGAVLAWVAGLVITLIAYKKLGLPLLRLQVLHAAFGAGLNYFLFTVMPQLTHQDIVVGEILRNSTSDRLDLWYLAIEITKHYPLLGAGPMHFPWFGPSNFHAHNSVLQLFCEWGIPATLIIVGLSVYGIKKWWGCFGASKLSPINNTDKNLAILLFSTVITNAAYSLVDGVIVMPLSQVMMFTVLGLMIGQYYHQNAHPTGAITQRKLGFRLIFAAIGLAALVWSNLPEVKNGITNQEVHFRLADTAINPRIWIQMTPPPKNEHPF